MQAWGEGGRQWTTLRLYDYTTIRLYDYTTLRLNYDSILARLSPEAGQTEARAVDAVAVAGAVSSAGSEGAVVALEPGLALGGWGRAVVVGLA